MKTNNNEERAVEVYGEHGTSMMVYEGGGRVIFNIEMRSVEPPLSISISRQEAGRILKFLIDELIDDVIPITPVDNERLN